MSTFMIEPGARLANRYRLDELVSETSGASLWKATDETLARPVGAWTFADGFSRTSEVVRAARAASRVSDARVTQVFDADESGPTPYVVQEWISGTTLSDLLRNGPLEPERAAGLIAEAAEALAAAAQVGIHHLRLTPDKLVWSVGGAVKVIGLGLDAALHNITVDDPQGTDAQGLGRLLYAALTGYWPGPEATALRPAPIVSGRPCEPAQVVAGIPDVLNTIVCRAAFPESGYPPLRTPQELVDALADVPRVVPIPMAQVASPPPPPRGTSRISGQLDVAAAASSTPRTSRSSRHRTPQATEGSLTNRILIGAVALLVFVAVVMGAWMLGSSMRDTSGTQTADVPGDKSEETELVVLTPVGATGFDPPPAGDNSEHDDKAPNTIDGDPSTHWNTEGYNSAAFGNYKDGVGLLIDMGTEVEIHEVDITFGSGTYSAELYVRNDSGGAPGEDEKPVWQGAGVTGKVPIKLDEPATGQYVVVWFVSPLSQDGGKYRGTINEVELRGIQ
ncbi:conserved hypothetical protein [Thermobifida fusca YX]|jgi:hypothetical protein|uniref:Protein kinase domain-containing protein n=1 Tax=Thermobifida fusca (strain YX) TaxID=269800 RepID=Q47K84_THEFY|nr:MULTISPECIES: protein kinase family protein [Thermobifida]AAZ57138.1 conserved hypothetical protein [Thermobifida fusca YX]MBO2528533.1 hypothetical protein [Thermobifida sp.]MDD6792114.1 protein kinase family protein [Thermobifida fusca]PPS94253.1 hypothetical protein BH05_06295 [Thermobifida fusca]PZN62210.1 MAG: hypothetical protein DIU53_11120 [Thermobifida fusca]